MAPKLKLVRTSTATPDALARIAAQRKALVESMRATKPTTTRDERAKERRGA